MTVTAEVDGWPAVRQAVLVRDRHSCVAVRRDLWTGVQVELAEGPCVGFDGTVGERITLRLDHVSMWSMYLRKAPDSEAFLQSVCDAHHATWATRWTARQASRERLSRLYPEEWAEWLAR